MRRPGIARYNPCMMIERRKPVVAGMFYPSSRDELSHELVRLCGAPKDSGRLESSQGLVAPHAGYVYSGAVAGLGYREAASHGTPQWAIILGSNHTGMGSPISIAIGGEWDTPLGTSWIEQGIAQRLVDSGASVAPEAFLREHSIEVQLPFLQHLFGTDLPFVPICVMLPALSDVIALGAGIASVASESPGIVIASSDFTHYEPDEVARQIDLEAIDLILALDVEGFYRKLIAERLTICGGGAIAVLMSCARTLGWQARLVEYATSGDITGDRSAVVGYAAISFIGGTDAK